MKTLRVIMVYAICLFSYNNHLIGSGFLLSPANQANVQTQVETLMVQVRSFNMNGSWSVPSADFAAADFNSGTDPALVITTPGTYKITADICVDIVTADIANGHSAQFKLRRTNNTAADLNATAMTIKLSTAGATSPTYTSTCFKLNADAAYTTTNSNDSITVFGDTTSGVPTDDAQVTSLYMYADRVF